MGAYTLKRRLLRPLTAVRRRRAGDRNELARTILAAHDYRPAMLRFFAATRANRDILIDVDLPEDAVVLDVGAYVGEWSQRILERADARGPAHLQVHAFEPEPSSVEQLRAGIGLDPRVHVHPVALGGRDRVERLAVGGQGSSIYVDPSTPGFLGGTEIELCDVDRVLTSAGIERIDLMKVNIEGGEYELLDRLHERGWLRRTGTVIVQFHEFAPGAYRGRRRNRRQLAETHRCTWDYPWVFERWDRR